MRFFVRTDILDNPKFKNGLAVPTNIRPPRKWRVDIACSLLDDDPHILADPAREICRLRIAGRFDEAQKLEFRGAADYYRLLIGERIIGAIRTPESGRPLKAPPGTPRGPRKKGAQ